MRHRSLSIHGASRTKHEGQFPKDMQIRFRGIGIRREIVDELFTCVAPAMNTRSIVLEFAMNLAEPKGPLQIDVID